MLSYEWICHSCKRSNAAHTDTCSHCGFGAMASGRDIKCAAKARAEQKRSEEPTGELQAEQNLSQATPDGMATSVVVSVFLVLGVMFFSFECFGANGKPFDVASFVQFWFRETALMAMLVAGLFWRLCCWLLCRLVVEAEKQSDYMR